MHLNKILTSVAASAVLALAAGSAQADTFQFALTGDVTATWDLDSNPVPISYAPGNSFLVSGVQGTFGSNPVSYSIFFRNPNDSANSGGNLLLISSAGNVVATTGAQLYGGSEGSPTFSTDVFTLTDYFAPSVTYSLTVTDVTAVPEPTNVALLLGGLGLFGTMAARRRNAK